MNDKKHAQSVSDVRLLAKRLTGTSLDGEEDRILTDDGKDLVAVLLGRRGGLRGGKIRAERLSAEERRRIAKLAANARWAKKAQET